MNTAAPSRKKLLSLVLTLVFMLTCLPAALAVDLNVDAGFYFKQSRGGTCTLASAAMMLRYSFGMTEEAAAMMLRRRAYFDGLTDWSTVTENSVRSTAWSNGLSHSFTYKEMQVGYGTLPSRKQEKVQTLITLLSQHPEGIVLYDRPMRCCSPTTPTATSIAPIRQATSLPDASRWKTPAFRSIGPPATGMWHQITTSLLQRLTACVWKA